ncbi:MAG TPA: RNA polymerase sigma factor [Polyangia bacterium]
MSADPHDGDLVLLLRQRRPGAFDEMFRRYKDRIWRFLVGLTGRTDRAEDLFQETWLAAARNAHNLRADSLLGPWLLTIARNKHRNGLRSLLCDHNKHTAFEGESSRGRAASPPDETAHIRQVTARVANALAGLPVIHREVLLLSVQEELDIRAMATVLGLREDAVRKRLSRARAELAHASGVESPIERTSSHE